MIVYFVLLCVVICHGQTEVPDVRNATKSLHNQFTERIGNFSIELLYHTAKTQPAGQNMIMSPFIVWTILAVFSEGATGHTRNEINILLRFPVKRDTRSDFGEIRQWLNINTSTIEFLKFNGILVSPDDLPLLDFGLSAKKFYDTDLRSTNFTNPETADLLNTYLSDLTDGKITKIVDSTYFSDAKIVLASALYFKGQWIVPFNKSSTTKQPFYGSNGKKIGEVNMMYNRFKYPFANIVALKARVIELPYGTENRLSMIIMLPIPGVSLEDMFYNFQKITLDSFFEELRLSKEEYSEDEVDCFIPRFKIKSDIDLIEVLRKRMSIHDLFDSSKARLPWVARTPVYVSKAGHKAEIQVTEDGTTASAETAADFSNHTGAVRFEANRPFTFMIIEKVTNVIVFGGSYSEPSLY